MSERLSQTIDHKEEVFLTSVDTLAERSLGSRALQAEVDNDEADVQLGQIYLDDDPVHDYMRQVRRQPLLSAEQEVAYAKAIEIGLAAEQRLQERAEQLDAEDQQDLMVIISEGKQAKEAMIYGNLGLVVSIARRYRGTNLDFLELIQEGNLGLIKAVDKFDYQRGTKFSTHGSWWIRDSIVKAIHDKSRMMRIPKTIGERIQAVKKCFAQTDTMLPIQVRQQMVAEELSENVDRVIRYLSYNEPLSLSGLVRVGEEGDSAELSSVITEENAEEVSATAEYNERRRKLAAALATLTEREAIVMELLHGLVDDQCYALEDIGKKLRLGRERTRQLRISAHEKLRKVLGSSLKEFVED